MRRELAEAFDARALVRAARALAGAGGLAWLDADGGAGEGRRAYLGAAPVEVVAVPWGDPAPFRVLRRLVGDPVAAEPALPRWIGWISYDAFWSGNDGRSQATPAPRMARGPLPVLRFARYDALLEVDLASGCAALHGDDAAALARFEARLAAPARPSKVWVGEPEVPPAAAHEEAIRRALAHVREGDIYQVNLARPWDARVEGDPLELFLAMRRASPVPLGAYVDGGDHQVLSRTMERFLGWEPDAKGRGPLVSRPIKGTIARGAESDAEGAATLRADPKERAEHAMIVDLVRNDLARVAEVGSVRVEAPLSVEPYAKLQHLVSTVRAMTREGTRLEDVLEATFPPGSVTGTPKLRALAIIEALEPVPRGPYCGAIGHASRGGELHLAVAIRTAVVREGSLRYHAGGGLVAASDAAREVAETELKARVFLDAVRELAGREAALPVNEN
ncbi:MAG: anthranilate synthase component I family protein [Myxococcota bacterium]